MSLAKFLKTVTATLALALAPTIAYAVNVSSDLGSGTQVVGTTYDNGYKTTGTLRVNNSARAIYYSGTVVYDGQPDSTCGRYTTNTSSTAYVSKGGTCRHGNGVPFSDADGGTFRICEDELNWPDGCGGWSSTDLF